MCSKHAEAWNKRIIKFSASSWLILINKHTKQNNLFTCNVTLRRILAKIAVVENQQGLRGAVTKFPELWYSTVMVGHMTTLT